jgi:hypothetical protein
MRKNIGIAAGVAAALAAIGGASVAIGAIPGASGTITACYSSDGSLRVLDKEAGKTCNKGWMPLSWNQTGPQGASGPQGPKGDQGDTGPSHAVVIRREANIVLEKLSGPNFTPVSSMSLPAGQWVISATASVISGNSYVEPVGLGFRCQLATGSEELDVGNEEQHGVPGHASTWNSLSLSGSLSTASASEVSFGCRDESGYFGDAELVKSTVTAIQVDSLTRNTINR